MTDGLCATVQSFDLNIFWDFATIFGINHVPHQSGLNTFVGLKLYTIELEILMDT